LLELAALEGVSRRRQLPRRPHRAGVGAHGQGLETLSTELAALASACGRRAARSSGLPIDRVLTVKGFGAT
jgi:hypothetical protein